MEQLRKALGLKEEKIICAVGGGGKRAGRKGRPAGVRSGPCVLPFTAHIILFHPGQPF